MPRIVVLTCELCGVVDSAENRVATVSVAGHKVELCAAERRNLLRMVNVTEEHAAAYVEMFDKRIGTQGANPTMSQVLEALAQQQAPAAELGEAAPEAADETLVSEPAAEDTRKVPAARKGK